MGRKKKSFIMKSFENQNAKPDQTWNSFKHKLSVPNSKPKPLKFIDEKEGRKSLFKISTVYPSVLTQRYYNDVEENVYPRNIEGVTWLFS